MAPLLDPFSGEGSDRRALFATVSGPPVRSAFLARIGDAGNGAGVMRVSKRSLMRITRPARSEDLGAS